VLIFGTIQLPPITGHSDHLYTFLRTALARLAFALFEVGLADPPPRRALPSPDPAGHGPGEHDLRPIHTGRAALLTACPEADVLVNDAASPPPGISASGRRNKAVVRRTGVARFTSIQEHLPARTGTASSSSDANSGDRLEVRTTAEVMMIKVVQAIDRMPIAQLPSDDAAAFERKLTTGSKLFKDRKAWLEPHQRMDVQSKPKGRFRA
jgi:hypothetical protein